jgi:hypothetical chaperone protein
VAVLEDEIGHDIAFAVEAGKIAANGAGAGVVDLAVVERGLSAGLPEGLVGGLLQPMAGDMAQAAVQTMAQAQVDPLAVTHLVFVGGSSLIQVTRTALTEVFPQAQVHHGQALTAIVGGLGLASKGAFE